MRSVPPARVRCGAAADPQRYGGSRHGRAAQRRSHTIVVLLGLLTAVGSVLYFVSDVIEAIQGGFSEGQLWLTLFAEAVIPIFVIGLAAAQRPRLGRLGEISAIGYAYSFVVFTGTVVYALVNGTKNYDSLTDQLGVVMTVHGAVMVVAGLGFGYAVLRARTLPAWTALALMAGVVLLALTQTMAEPVRLAAAALRDLGFAGMGAALVRSPDLFGRQGISTPQQPRQRSPGSQPLTNR
jgi:hypothetical protein